MIPRGTLHVREGSSPPRMVSVHSACRSSGGRARISGLAPGVGTWGRAKELTGKGTREEAPNRQLGASWAGASEPGLAPVAPAGPRGQEARPLLPPPGTRPSRWSPDAAKGALPAPAPAGASGASAPSTQPLRGLQGRLGDPRPSSTALWAFPRPPLPGVWCPRPWAYCRGPSCHCGHSLCLQFRELDKEIRKTFKQVLSSSPSFIALTPQEFTSPWRSAHGSSAPSAGFAVCVHKGVYPCTPRTADTRADMHAPTGSPPGLLRSSDAQLCGGLFLLGGVFGAFQDKRFPLSVCLI